MERPKREKRHRRKAPRVPIKTYRWEDIRRERLRGGYPWTYLYKEPFNEEIDPQSFTMESKPKEATSSTPRKFSDQLEIKEITNGSEYGSQRGSLTPEPSGYIVITEVPSDSENHSKDAPRGSVVIEDIGEVEAMNLESAEDSDNISQYLDKEEPPAEPAGASTQTKKDEEVKAENGRQERSKSEEPKRKRKLSIDSSYSRKSLSKLAIMKKIKEAKDKIKVPKLNLPSLPNLSVLSNPLKQETESKPKKEPKKEPEKELKKESKKEPEKKQAKAKTTHAKADPNAKPVYIHIPLKPPEGQTDEFSYLEFGDKKPEQPSKEEELKKQLEETPTIEISEAFDDQRRFSENPDDIVAFEIVKTETIDMDNAAKNGLQGGNDYLIIEQDDDEKSESRSMIIIMSGGEEGSLSRTPSVRQTPSRQGSRKARAKSAEPERKRKLSGDSGCSRNSLSKLGFLQKLKDAKDKFKLPKFSLSRSNSKKAPSKKTKEEETAPKEPTTEEKKSKPEGKISKVEGKKSGSKSDEPKYIHIPLKPPPGETDEFSHLEFEEKKVESPPVKAEPSGKEEQESSIESPGSPKTEGVQFIFLTPPSDDEVLEPHEIPETPSSESKGFFSGRLHELKQLAKDAVDAASPKSRKKLQPVREEESSDVAATKTEDEDYKKKETDAKEPKTETESQKPDDVLKVESEKETSTVETGKETPTIKTEKEVPVTEIPTTESKGETPSADSKKETLAPESKKDKSKTKGKKEKAKGGTKKEKQEKDENKKPEEIKEKQSEDIKEKKLDDTKLESEDKKSEKMVVDEEDGLKLTESAMAKQEQNVKAKEVVEPSEETKSNLKSDGSPVMKKKVSFKRRSRDDSKDGDYEDIQAPKDDKSSQKNTTDDHKSKLAVMGNSQSMSVDEEKSYLDEQKIIKSTSLEEDYNRWSKLSDHEYEPVNPPPDNVNPVISLVGVAPPTVHVIDTDHGLEEKPGSLASSTTSLERRMLGAEVETSPEETLTVQEMQTEIENKFFGKTASTPSQPQATVHTITTVTTTETKTQPPKSEGPGKFQQAIKAQTDKFKTKLHEMKKPNIKLPSKPTLRKPNLQKFKFEKPKINLPKLPETSKISLPTFSLTRKSPVERSLKKRQLSTESNAGGSKKNYFDFRTYPRLFKKKPKDDIDSFSSKSEREVPEFATVPRTKRNKEDDQRGGRDSIRIPLHAQESVEDEEREDSVERRMASHIRYDQDIDIDDAYERENQEIHAASPFSHDYNSRWNHGSFHPQSNQEFSEDTTNRQVTDLDSPGDGPAPHESFDTNTSKDIHSSESSLGIHRRGVLEEIDSDEFFLREKGISQDNIEVGMYLSSEIREAFKYPSNALADLQRGGLDFSFDPRASNQSLPETPSKRKAVKKPKRKKTPHVSQEQISFDQDSELDLEIPPSRPKRRSRRNKKQKDPEGVIPYQETIAVDVPDVNIGIMRRTLDHEHLMYENEQMQGKEQPEIKLTDPYAEYRARYDSEDEVFKEEVREEFPPLAPPRKHRSLKSLTYSEHDSILGDVDPDREPLPDDVEVYKTEHEYMIPTPEVPPIKPPRTLSRSSSKSHDNEEIRHEFEETPVKPTRTRSRSGTRSHGDSLTLEEPEEPQEPCVEEPCVQDIRDSMGYAIVDKNVKREPPLPPPRTPPRRRRGVQSSEQGFFTVPRPLNDEPPTRPLRNYSTLGPSRPPRRKQPINMTDEEKENIDITQYIEIEDEPNRDLHSGEVIQKMRDRPLPAPPRPPRKTRPLQEISSLENIVSESQEDRAEDEKAEFFEEAEVSTQTEPLPDDFVCEEMVHEEIIVPKEQKPVEHSEPIVVERRLITPTQYSFEETITHGSLIVEPLNGAKILPDSELTRPEKSLERIVPVSKDYDDETSEIPEEFSKLRDPEPVQTSPAPLLVSERSSEQPKDPRLFPSVQTGPPQPSVIERIIERPVLIHPDSSSEVEVLKAQRLQVSDLDVDRLSVNELLASRIIVSEIEGGSIQANEISSKSGALKIGEIELPPGIVQQLFEKLQSVAQEQSSGPTEPAADTLKEAGDETGQKKNSV